MSVYMQKILVLRVTFLYGAVNKLALHGRILLLSISRATGTKIRQRFPADCSSDSVMLGSFELTCSTLSYLPRYKAEHQKQTICDTCLLFENEALLFSFGCGYQMILLPLKIIHYQDK